MHTASNTKSSYEVVPNSFSPVEFVSPSPIPNPTASRISLSMLALPGSDPPGLTTDGSLVLTGRDLDVKGTSVVIVLVGSTC